VPFLALAVLIVVPVIIDNMDGGNTPRVAAILYAILFLLAALASTATVCVAVARNEIEERYYRFALIPATVATVTMILILGLMITWGLRLQADVPYLFYGQQTLGNTMNTTTQAEWLGVVIVMAISIVIAIGALIRGLPARMVSRAA
jgi:hypothetical protein